MKTLSLVTLFATLLASQALARSERSFHFMAPTPISIVAETFAKLGDFNVVVSPDVRGDVTLEWTLDPVEALERLAQENQLHATQVPYATGKPTYILSTRTIDPATLKLSGSAGEGARFFEFRRPTPLNVVVNTMGMLAGVEARWEGATAPAITLELGGLTSIESLHVVAHALGAVVETDGKSYVVKPGSATPAGEATREMKTLELE